MEFKKAFKISFLFGFWLFLIHILAVWSILDLGFLGIYPRKIHGLLGILTAPFIHGSWEHLYSNAPPLIALFTLLFYFHQKIAVKIILGVWLLTGIFVWIFARPVYHIGFSGVLYGLVAFIGWNGIFRKDMKSISLSLMILIYFGGMASGILPGQEKISWESHLLGAISGIIISYFYRNNGKEEEMPKGNEEEQSYFLDRDTFKPFQNSFLRTFFEVSFSQRKFYF
ncbi:MAG: hypothetical protein RJA52_40 [Bacteroidota bacterium]|jgi:membrane associated rhomboid family serine protease